MPDDGSMSADVNRIVPLLFVVYAKEQQYDLGRKSSSSPW
jgi:hypothetical protein